jgi:hypothetical protein
MPIKFLNDVAVDSSVLYVDTINDRVGIGTTEPRVPLQVSSSEVDTDFLIECSNTQARMSINNTSTGDSQINFQLSNSSKFAIGVDNSDSDKFKISGSSALGSNDRLVVDSTGNVGIGTTGPTAPLHIQGGATSEVLKIEANANPYIRWVENGTNVGMLFFSSTNAYLSNMSNGSLLFRTNNTDKMTITGGGNVGIGTTNPTSDLHISDNFPRITLQDTDGTNTLSYIDQDGSYLNLIARNGTNNGNIRFRRYDGTTTTDSMIINSSGNVGIGTTNPATKLHIGTLSTSGVTTEEFRIQSGTSSGNGGTAIANLVTGAFGTSGIYFGNQSTYTSQDAYLKYADSSNATTLHFSSSLNLESGSSGSRMYINSVGNVGIGTTAPADILHVDGARSNFNGIKIGENSTNIQFIDDGKLAVGNNDWLIFTEGGQEFMRAGGQGNVGIGTTSPAHKLHVVGNTKIEGVVIVNSANSSLYIGDSNTGQSSTSTGDRNVVIGPSAFRSNTSAKYNTAVGHAAMQDTTTGNYNSVLGNQALRDNIDGDFNVAVGNQTMAFTTNSSNNTAVGYRALYQAQSDSNTAIGQGAFNSLQSSTSSGGNTGIGQEVLNKITSGRRNVGVGYAAGQKYGGGNNNVVTANDSVFIGADSDAGGDNQTNQIVIGYNAIGLGSNTAVLGNNSIVTTQLKGNVGINTTNPNQKLTIKGNDNYVATEQTNYVWGGTNTIGVRMGTSTAGVLDFRRWDGGVTHGTAAITQTTSDGGWGLDFRVDNKSTNTSATTSRMFLSTSGEVGIGTRNPSEKLHVYNGSAYITPIVYAANQNDWVIKTGAYNNTAFDQGLKIKSTSGGTSYMAFETTSAVETMVLRSGKVGIGTTNPTSKLTVVDDILLTGSSPSLTLTDATSSFVIKTNTSGEGVVQTNGTSKPIRFFRNNGSSESMRIDGFGNVGIGITAPTVKLHIGSASNSGSSTEEFRIQTATGSGYGGNAVVNLNTGAFGKSGIYFGNNGVLSYANQDAFLEYDDYSGQTKLNFGNTLTINKGTSSSIYINSFGRVGLGTTSPQYQLQLSTNSAAKPTSSSWTVVSDERVKTNIRPYETGLQELLQIEPKLFDYNGKAGFDATTKNNIGVIAQEIKDVMPETVKKYNAKLNEEDEEDTELYNFDSHALTFALINSVKELNAKIKSLETKIQTLENQ